MRGMVGEFRWDDMPAAGPPAFGQPPGTGALDDWRSEDGRLTLAAWGGRAPNGCEIGWHVDSIAGVVAVVDCSLYDRGRLANSLGLGQWAGSSAELLLRAWQQWGDAMLARLDGDFAFVICDLNERTVIAASDPMGMRALFYCHRSGQGFAFSTCPEALARWVGAGPAYSGKPAVGTTVRHRAVGVFRTRGARNLAYASGARWLCVH